MSELINDWSDWRPSPELAHGVRNIEWSARAQHMIDRMGFFDMAQVAGLGDGWLSIPGIGRKTFDEIKAACAVANVPWGDRRPVAYWEQGRPVSIFIDLGDLWVE